MVEHGCPGTQCSGTWVSTVGHVSCIVCFWPLFLFLFFLGFESRTEMFVSL